jgi:hydrogenase maturation protease
MRLLVIGCGNADRGDDAAGILVARRLRQLGVEAVEAPGDALALIAGWEGADRVILVDAVVSGGRPGEVAVWDARREVAPRGSPRRSTHAYGVAEAVELARVLDLLPPSLTVYGIEGVRFDPGTQPSPEVESAVDRVAAQIAMVAGKRSEEGVSRQNGDAGIAAK